VRQQRQQQRERVLRAMVEVVVERGFGRVSVGLVIARAGVSRRAFYEQFEGLEDCFLAVLDLGLQRAIEVVGGAFARERSWRVGLRCGLAALLVFLDSEPLFARVWLVESLAAGSWALERRERNVARLRGVVLSSWPVSGALGSPSSPSSSLPSSLAAEGVMASLLGVVHTHLVMGRPGPLIELLGPLMGLVTSPYLDARGVAWEVERGAELARAIQAGERRVEGGLSWSECSECSCVEEEVPAMLRNARAHRARRCVRYLAEHPGVNNGQIAAGIGVTHQGQVSRLLGGLCELGLLVKHTRGVGRPVTWRLTPYGERVVVALID